MTILNDRYSRYTVQHDAEKCTSILYIRGGTKPTFLFQTKPKPM